MSEHEPYTATRQALVDGREPLVYSHCRLVVTAGPDAGRRLETEKDVIRIGSNPENDLVLRDPAVSRSHLELHKKAGAYHLVDVGSSNGTFVGNLEVREATLRTESELNVGDSTLKFEPLTTEIEVEPHGESRLGEMVGESVEMREIFTIVQRVARTELAVLVTGETGTGKELVARAVHQLSRRSDGPFVTLALGALPPALVESALFGHERGAFQGADEAYAGAFERADGGTLFLDEVHELPAELQPRLLRALERGEIQRLRGSQPIRVNTRVVAAVSADVQARVDDGRFRDDLYYRLAVIRVDLPPLRDRKEDIPAIVEHFFEHNAEELTAMGVRARRLSAGALTQLRSHDFPGNVRELINVLRRAVVIAGGSEVEAGDLPAEITGRKGSGHGAEAPSSMVMPDSSMRFKDAKAQVLDAFERQYLQDLLQRHDQNISKAAREAGIDRRHLYRLLDKYSIEASDRDD